MTTCNSSYAAKLSDCNFKRVIIDEATQARESETLLSCLKANQLVLIGD